ncbi:MAG: 30S ribosomal protein S12 methylthiotransferase RimO [Bacteroidales bacterium]|nr:30S ribosomal protein S12 methylthiotransferase RimO [Bacteroidales bacterium]
MQTKKTNDKISIITLGCSKNLVDSEVLLAQIKANKINASHDFLKNKTDIVIINTCGFINDAKEESINTILKFTDAKRKGLIKKVIVFGCLVQRYKDELKKEIPGVDAFFGVDDLYYIIKNLKADYNKNLCGERELATPSHYAYLKISEGCNRKCSFCAIPLIRGKYISKPIENIVYEAKLLAAKGVKELILIAQDLTFYGMDLYGKQKLSYLLEKLSEIDKIKWLRLQYAYPAGFPHDVLDVIKNNDKVCKYLDIPFQHINDNILKSMQRGITKKQSLELIDKIRNKVPGIALRTSLMVGYPTETKKEFDELMEFVEKTKFERLGVFTYSSEEKTKSYELKDAVLQKAKQQRFGELMELQRKISLRLNKNKTGKTIKVLIDKKEGNHYIGRTEYDSPEVDNEVVINKNKSKIKIGNLYTVKITGASDYDLYASIT